MVKISKLDSIVTYNMDLSTPGSPKAISFDKILRKPTLDYGSRGDFQPSEFNLYEIGIIEDVESYVRQAFQKKAALMFKEGEEFTGKNKQTINYIKKRIRQIERVSNLPWRQLLRETGYYLVSRSNFFWVVVRNENLSGGKTVDGKKPIAAFFPMAPETVEIKKNLKTGIIESYRQRMPDGRFKEFSPNEVIHFYAYRKTGFNFGTPAIVSAKDDIRALRRIEENVELLVYQNLFPIFHYKVGSDTKPAGQVRLPDGTVVDEVEYVKAQISHMPSEGGIVTPERHEIQFIGAEGKGLRAEGYLDYFKTRVFAGLGASSVDFGEGNTANRATADNMSRIMVDSVKDYQDILEEFINHHIIVPLLNEAKLSLDLLDEENIVEFKFKEIDIETQLKKNVNAQLLYGGNLLDVHEARKAAGHEPLVTSQEKDMFSKRVTIAEAKVKLKSAESIAELSAETSLKAAAMKPAPISGGGVTTGRPKTKSPAANTAKIQSAPRNQHGTKTGPQKSKLDSFVVDSIASTRWKQLKQDVVSELKTRADRIWIETLVSIALSDMKDKYISSLETDFFRGYREYRTIPSRAEMDQAKRYFTNKLNSYIKILIDSVNRRLKNGFSKNNNSEDLVKEIESVFDSLEYRLNFFDTTERARAANIGRALSLKAQGKELANIERTQDCSICNQEDHTLDLDFLSFDDVPPTHSNCSCKVVLSDFTKAEERCILKTKRQLGSEHPSWNMQRITSAATAFCRSSSK